MQRQSVNRRRARLQLLKAGIVSGAVLLAGASSATARDTASTEYTHAPVLTLRGIVFDSLTQRTAPGAEVWIRSARRTTKTDKDGRFEFSDLEIGTYVVEWATAATDSAGLSSLMHRVEVSRPTVEITLASPSFPTLWRRICGASTKVNPDQGILWGTVRDAESDIRQSGARTYLRWYDANSANSKRMSLEERASEFTTDSTGTFYACGVPADLNVRAQSVGAMSATGEIAVLIGETRVRRLDMWVSRQLMEEVPVDSSVDSVRSTRTGTARIQGIVRDTLGNAVVNATVSIEATGKSVRTDSSGRFAFDNVPSGSQEIELRHIGFAPITRTLHVRSGDAERVDLVLARANQLSAFNVRAPISSTRDRDDYLARRRAGFGFAIDSTRLQGASTLSTVLRSVPSILVSVDQGITRVQTNPPRKYARKFVRRGQCRHLAGR
ncbi:MAG: carboxypeptidase regulatory-like domain-containing protein [Gemmatimonas sp.]